MVCAPHGKAGTIVRRHKAAEDKIQKDENRQKCGDLSSMFQKKTPVNHTK